MAVKELDGVFAEAREQIYQFPRGGVIDTEFVNPGRSPLGIGAVSLSGTPKRCWNEGRGWNRLEQSSSFHGRDSSRGRGR